MWSAVKWSEVKWRCLVECVYYHGLTVMQFVCGLLYSMSCSCCCCLIAVCFMPFALCYVLINCFMLFNFSFCLFSCFLCFASYFVCSVFLYSFSPCICCVQLYRPLSPGGNPTAVNKHIMSCHNTIYRSNMVCCRCIIVNTPHRGDK
jgi:hypothetical protein